MNTLTTPPLSALLAQLFAESEATLATVSREIGNWSPEERAALMGDSGYRTMYARLKDYHLAVSRETGALCYMLARACRARSIVEFGTSFGISTLHLAAALKDNGGGRVISSEFEPSKVARARGYMAAAGLADFVEIREGDALETLARNLPDTIDFVLLDGAKGLYIRVLSLLEKRLRAGALIIADNADLSPEYVARIRASDGGYLSLPYGVGLEVSVKTN
jgi:predicted O-methyltransferase YrrM